MPPPPRSTLFPYTTLFRSRSTAGCARRRQASFAATKCVRRSRSEEHTSELQSRGHLVCRLLLEKKKNGGSIASSVMSHVGHVHHNGETREAWLLVEDNSVD